MCDFEMYYIVTVADISAVETSDETGGDCQGLKSTIIRVRKS